VSSPLTVVKTIRKNQRYFFVVGVGGFLFIVGLIGYMVFLFSGIISIDKEIKEYQERFSMYENATKNYPSPEREAFLSETEKKLTAILEPLRNEPLFRDKIVTKDISSASPLKFKEELFSVKKSLEHKAQKEKVIIPNDFGFYTWEQQLPKEAELEQLFRSLKVVKVISVMAISSRVSEIESVDLSDVVSHFYNGQEEGEHYLAQDIRLRMRGDFEQLVQFLYEINSSPLLLNVKQVRIFTNSKDEERRRSRQKKREKKEPEAALISEIIIVNTYI